MSDKPEVPQKAPYKIEMEPGEYSWCACGRSKNQPFCDGSHAGTSFSPIKFTVDTKRVIGWCGCKHSAKGAICDGSHKKI